MKCQLNYQTLTLCQYFIGEGKLGMALFLLEVNTRNYATAYKEVLQLKCRHHTLMDKVIELSPKDRVTQLNRISYAVLDFIFEHLEGSSSSLGVVN